MKSNLEFVEHDKPTVDEHNGLPHVTVVTVFWKGLLFLRAVRYIETRRDSYSDEDDDEDGDASSVKTEGAGPPSKANNYAGCETQIYLYSELEHFHLVFDRKIQSLDEVRTLALEAEKTLVKFARGIHMRKSKPVEV